MLKIVATYNLSTWHAYNGMPRPKKDLNALDWLALSADCVKN
jgi:hypothetical protein